jgi:hypothetical protein
MAAGGSWARFSLITGFQQVTRRHDRVHERISDQFLSPASRLMLNHVCTLNGPRAVVTREQVPAYDFNSRLIARTVADDLQVFQGA